MILAKTKRGSLLQSSVKTIWLVWWSHAFLLYIPTSILKTYSRFTYNNVLHWHVDMESSSQVLQPLRRRRLEPVWPDWAIFEFSNIAFHFLAEVAQIFCICLGYFEKHHFIVKNYILCRCLQNLAYFLFQQLVTLTRTVRKPARWQITFPGRIMQAIHIDVRRHDPCEACFR